MENIRKIIIPILIALVLLAIIFFGGPENEKKTINEDKMTNTIEKQNIASSAKNGITNEKQMLNKAKHHRFKMKGIMSTEIDLHIIAEPDQDVDKITAGLKTELIRLAKIFNPYNPQSELSLVNQNAYEKKTPISNELYHVIDSGIKYSALSKGEFDISILPLVRLWKIRDKKNLTTPSEKEIQDVLKLVDYKSILLEQGQVRFQIKGMALGLGGIAKGFIIDKGIDYLKSQGIKNALVNIGGDLYALGHKINGEKWITGITNPRKEKYKNKSEIGVIYVEDFAVATSGDYERYRRSKSGKRLHHILSTKTGHPSESKCISVTITAALAIEADSVATIVFTLGPEKGLEFIEKINGVEGLIVYEGAEEINWVRSSHFQFVPIDKFKR